MFGIIIIFDQKYISYEITNLLPNECGDVKYTPSLVFFLRKGSGIGQLHGHLDGLTCLTASLITPLRTRTVNDK